MTINLTYIFFFLIKSFDDITKCFKVLLYSIVTLSVFGVVQFFIVKTTGVNPFPINGSDGVTHSGYVFNTVFRINSLAGEPKHMAIASVIGVIIIVTNKLNKIISIKFEKLILLLFLFNLFFTYSTTGYVLLTISLGAIVIINRLFNWKTFIFGTLLMIIGVGLFSKLSEIEKKSFVIQKDKAEFEIQDQSIIDYFSDNPLNSITGLGLGNIHYYSVKYIPENFPLFKDTPYKANSGILFMISDYGIIGFITIILLILNVFEKNKKLLKSNNFSYKNESLIITNFSLILFIIFLFRYYELFYIFLGIMIKINKELIKTRKVNLNTIF